ncbi:unnamed protein product [Trichobilharzia regenti]|nr:unnamed protein product [Trichobilharzia regenti]
MKAAAAAAFGKPATYLNSQYQPVAEQPVKQKALSLMSSDWAVSKRPFTAHTDSVEDIQWSPTEPTVFISVSSDRSLRVWDVRVPECNKSVLCVPEAHSADINVASWSHLKPINLLTGGDDGTLKIWDLRLIHSNASQKSKSSSIRAYTHLFDVSFKTKKDVLW